MKSLPQYPGILRGMSDQIVGNARLHLEACKLGGGFLRFSKAFLAEKEPAAITLPDAQEPGRAVA